MYCFNFIGELQSGQTSEISTSGIWLFCVFGAGGGRMSFNFSRNSALIDFALRHFG